MFIISSVLLLLVSSGSRVSAQGSCDLTVRGISDFPSIFPSYPPQNTAFYAKFINVRGFPVMSSAKTTDAALIETARWVCNMFDLVNPQVVTNMIGYKGKQVVMARYPTEKTRDVPEHAWLDVFYDERARGLGATISVPTGSNAEENVLCDSNDRYRGECIMIHEFAHTMSELSGNSTFLSRLNTAYDESVNKNKKWGNTYAATNVQEYFAEGVQDWFDCNAYSNPSNGIHNDINTRDKLKTYDPTLYRIIGEFFRETPLKYSCPAPVTTTSSTSATSAASSSATLSTTSVTSATSAASTTATVTVPVTSSSTVPTATTTSITQTTAVPTSTSPPIINSATQTGDFSVFSYFISMMMISITTLFL